MSITGGGFTPLSDAMTEATVARMIIVADYHDTETAQTLP
jgi:hypothetical protein